MERDLKEIYEEQIKKYQAEALKKAILLKYLSKNARERINRIKIVKPELAEKLEIAIVQSVNSGQINKEISEEEIINILKLIEGDKKREFKIIRK